MILISTRHRYDDVLKFFANFVATLLVTRSVTGVNIELLLKSHLFSRLYLLLDSLLRNLAILYCF